MTSVHECAGLPGLMLWRAAVWRTVRRGAIPVPRGRRYAGGQRCRWGSAWLGV